MIKFFTLTITLLCATCVSAAVFNNSSSEYYDYLTKKTIEDFNTGVKHYNESKPASAPGVYKGAGQKFNIVIKNNRIQFTVLNYIKDEMFVNGFQVKRSAFGLKNKKTTWIHLLISDAIADDGDLDAETTTILLAALGGLEKNLEEVGMMCFMGCEKDVKKNNKKKILDSLELQHNDCSNQLYAQEDTIKKYPSYNMVSLLHSTFNPEFASVKALIQKVSEANTKKVKEFMTKKMLVTKNYQTCVEVITSGTVADGAYGALEKGISVMTAGGVASMVIEEEIEKAKTICVKMEELRTCLVTLKKNLNTINSIKRSVNKSGYNIPLETLPEIKNIER
ncbi:MAG: hypothetical protein H7336_02930 [Bacteriovorax sp.]|nr:hypothetical protein [Bacteriovorax sp.]